MTRTAEDFHARAVEHSIRGRYSSALRALDAAAQRTADVDLHARVAGTRALVLQRTGDPGGAEALCRAALAADALSGHTRAVLYGQLGALAGYGGRLDEADAWLSRAVQSLTGDPVAAARVRMNRALVALQRRRLTDAVGDLEEAARAFAARGLVTEEAHARHNLGYAALLEGDLVAALAAMSAARGAAASSPVAAAIGDVDRAEVLRDAGLAGEAERILARAAATFGAHRMPQSRAEAEFQLARSLLSHDPERAGRAAADAARRLRALGNEAGAVRAAALRLRADLSAGAVTYAGGRVGRAARVPSAEEVEALALALEQRAFRGEAAALRLSGELSRLRRLRRSGRPVDADAPRRVVRVPPSAGMDVRMLAHEVRAERAAAAGRNGEARRHAAEGLDMLSGWQASFGSLDLQTSVAMHGAGLVYAGVAAALRGGRPDAVFEWSERARHLSQQVMPLRPPPDPALATELAELRMLRAADPDGDWLADPRAAALRDAARQRQWSGTGSARTEPRLPLAQLQASLDEGTALVAFLYPGEALTALVVTSDRAVVCPPLDWPAVRRALGGLRADLDMSASVRGGPIADVVRRSLDDRLAVLSGVLLTAALAVAGDRRLVITVPGVLNGIPWAMLPAMRGRAFTLATSATRWAGLRADPVPTPQTAGFVAGPRVARGQEEVDAAASGWPVARTLAGESATVDAVADLASIVDLLHIAAHGRHAVDHPLFSGLELVDGALFGYDVDRMPQVPATVVLSACEGGRSAVRWGEEAIGMTRVWLHAGTRTVVATPVVVADDVACELLGAMHEGLRAGLPPAEALAAASGDTGLVAPFQSHGFGF